MGLDVGFSAAALNAGPIGRSGFELDIRTKPDCYVVKSPWIATYIDQVVSRDDIVIDHAIICIRNLHDAAESRRRVEATQGPGAAGGLWETRDPKKQEEILGLLFHKLIFHLSEHDIPLTFLHFPRFATDSGYFAAKLCSVFPKLDPLRLVSVLRSEVRPDLIHFRPPTTLVRRLG